METCKRTQSNDRLWLILSSALGTLLLAFVPSEGWLNGAAQTEAALSAIFVKQVLTALLLLIVPSLCAALVHRTSPWAILGLVAFAFGAGLLVTRDPKDALYTTLLCALPGIGLWGLQKLKLSNFRTVIYESFVILAALFGFVCLRDLIRTGDAYASYKELVRMYDDVLSRFALSESTLYGVDLQEETAALVDMFRLNAESYCVSFLLLPSMAAALSDVLFSHLWNRNGETALTPLPRFSEWRCERRYVILTVGFVFVTMILGLMGARSIAALSGVAALLWRMPCMLGGLCAVRRLGLRMNRNWIFGAAIVMLILLPPATGMLLSLLGLVSAMQKRMNVGEDGERK